MRRKIGLDTMIDYLSHDLDSPETAIFVNIFQEHAWPLLQLLTNILLEEIVTLPAHQKEILKRYFWQGESYRNIAEQLDISHMSVSRELKATIVSLREKILKRVTKLQINKNSRGMF